MYKGKFASNAKGAKDTNRIPPRKETPAKSPAPAYDLEDDFEDDLDDIIEPPKAKKAVKEPAAKKGLKPQRPPQEAPVKPAKAEKAVKEKKPVKEAPAKARKQPQIEVEAVPERRGPRLGSVIFYTFYFMFILIFFVGVFFLLQWLHGWLSDYEAAQPTVKCEQVFQQLFGDPDWEQLYPLTKAADTEFEGKEEYVAYMESKVGDGELSYQETASGLSDDKKYFIKLGDERLGYFTLVAEGKTDNITDIPDWKLGEVELYLERNESVRIQKVDGHTVTVNGVALSDDYTIQIATTLAEQYLPTGITGAKTCVQEVTGLLAKPEIAVKNEKGEAMVVEYDAEKDMYIEKTEANTISDAERDVALNAAKAYSYRMIEEYNKAGQMTTYFDTTSEIYKTIMSITPWMQDHNGYKFANEQVTNYARYSEDLFSAKVSFSLNVTRTNGTVKEYTVDQTLFFQKQNGAWKCIDMVNVDVTKPVGKVRLTFMDESEKTVLSSEFYETESEKLTVPVLSAPSGKVFSGWVRKITTESGTTLSLVFQPDASGNVKLSGSLEPMTLYPLFENPEDISTPPADAGMTVDVPEEETAGVETTATEATAQPAA